jgi:hypothetical protein
MPKSFFLFVLLLLPLITKAQQLDSIPDWKQARPQNALLVEIGGSFVWPGGIHFEHSPLKRSNFLFTIRTGLGVNIWERDKTAVALPIGLSANFGSIHYFEAGLNGILQIWATRVTDDQNTDVSYHWHSSLGFQPLIGYRYQPDERGGFLFRTSLTTLPFSLCPADSSFFSCPDSTFSLWIGLSMGFLF